MQAKGVMAPVSYATGQIIPPRTVITLRSVARW
jgi:hypothetical protein